MPGPSLGPLHCRFIERQCEIKAWKRSAQTRGRSNSYTWKLAELPPRDTNKTELFKFLSQAIFTWFYQDDKQLVIIDGEAVLSKPPLLGLALLTPCSHEEADSRMLLHVSHAAHHCHHKILINTVDTDVVVLAVSVAQGLLPEDELWLAFGTGKSFRYLAAPEIAAGLGPEKAQALPMFHVLTGCDTASSFAGHGKKTARTI